MLLWARRAGYQSIAAAAGRCSSSTAFRSKCEQCHVYSQGTRLSTDLFYKKLHTADGPRDVICQSKSCQLLCCTTVISTSATNRRNGVRALRYVGLTLTISSIHRDVSTKHRLVTDRHRRGHSWDCTGIVLRAQGYLVFLYMTINDFRPLFSPRDAILARY